MVLAQDQRLRFASNSDNMVLVEKMINDVCEQYEVKEDFYGNILIAITEAVINAIHHGNKSDPKKNVEVAFKSSNDTIAFTVKDEGEGFDPDGLPDPTNPENIEKPNGRGVFLMRNLADKVSFDDRGRSVTLEFKLQQAA